MPKLARAVLSSAETVHQRLGAVMAGAHRDALAVEQRRDVVRVRVVEREGDHAAAILRPAEDAHALDGRQPRAARDRSAPPHAPRSPS